MIFHMAHNLDDGTCSGTIYEVAEDGTTTINIDGRSSNPMVALHVGARVSNRLNI